MSLATEDRLHNALEIGDFQTALPLLSTHGPLITIGPEGFTPLHYACRHGEAEVTRLLITQYHYSIESTSIHGQTPAHVAAQYGHVNALGALVESASDGECGNGTDTSNATSPPATVSDITSLCDLEKNTPLHTAVACGQLPVVQYLIHDLQCGPACTNLKSETPLHLAAKNGHLDVIKYLLNEVGCPTSPVDDYGGTPLYTAAGHGQIEVVQYLVEEKAFDPNVRTTKRWEGEWRGIKYDFGPGRTLLHTASREGHLTIIQYLVNELKCDPSCRDEDGVTPLYLAGQAGHLAIVKFIVIECQCDPNVATNDGSTPLHGACKKGHFAVVHFLTEKGSDPLARNKNGNTPVNYAALNGRLDVLKSFITEKGCDPMTKGRLSRTPVHSASKKGHLETVQYLINEHQVDPSCQDEGGWTPLHLASQNGHLAVVRFLTDKGCVPLARNKNGNTPVSIAALTGRLDVLKFFITEKGCDPMERSRRNRTLVHYASEKGHLEAVQYLINVHQVDPSCQDEGGWTPLHLATRFGHIEVVKFLIEKANCDPFQLVNYKARYAPMSLAVKQNHDHIASYLHSKGVPIPKSFKPVSSYLDPCVRIYCIGNQSMGKSTLVKALSTEGAFDKLRKVRNVAPQTAGIVPLEFNSGIYGRVTFYDFAGHKEYYASHEVVFERDSHQVILLTVNVSEDDEIICAMLRFWKHFLVNVVSTSCCQAHTIIVGSHADHVSSQLQGKRVLLLENFESMPSLRVVDTVLLDCRNPSSSGMSKLRDLLKETCKRVRIQSQYDYQKGGTLKRFIEKYLKKSVVLTVLELYSRVLNTTEPELEHLKTCEVLYQTCESLSISGHILLLRDRKVPEESWVILQKDVILSQIHGLLKHMKQSSELGIVPLSLVESLLQNHAQGLPSDLAIKYMKKMVLCSEIDPQALTRIKGVPHESVNDNEKYFFFSSLVSVEKPSLVRDWNPEQVLAYASGWHLKCTNPDHFFTPRFLQVLLVDLACQFALKINEDSPVRMEAKKGCIIWKNGIRWLDRSGIEVIVEVSNDGKLLILTLKSLMVAKLQCTFLRSTLIHEILNIKSKLCGELELAENFIHPLYFEQSGIPVCVPETNTPEPFMIPLSDVSNALLQHGNQIVVDQMPCEVPFLSVNDLLHFEPYHGIGVELLLTLYNPHNEHKVIKYPELEKITEAFKFQWDNVAIALKSGQASTADLRIKADAKKWRTVFREWSGRKGTWGALRRDLDQYSVFQGRNLLHSCSKDVLQQELQLMQQKMDLSETMEQQQEPVIESPTPTDPYQPSPPSAHSVQTDNDIDTLIEITDTSPLGIELLLEVRTELEIEAVVDHSTNLGLSLGLCYTTLREIQQENQQNIALQFTEIIAAWLRGADQAGTPSWRSLTKALITPTVDCPLIARRIAERRLSGSVDLAPLIAYSFSVAQLQNVDNTCLGRSSLRNVTHAVWRARHRWFHLGLVFGLTYDTMKSIQIDHHKTDDWLHETVTSWLCLRDQVKKQGHPSWRTLVRALTHPLVDEMRLAEELAETHKVHIGQSGDATSPVPLSSSDPSHTPPSHSPASST